MHNAFFPNLGRLVSPKLCEIALAKNKIMHLTFTAYDILFKISAEWKYLH